MRSTAIIINPPDWKIFMNCTFDFARNLDSFWILHSRMEKRSTYVYIFPLSIFFFKEEIFTNAITVFRAFFLKSSANSSRALHSLKRTGFLNYAGAENNLALPTSPEIFRSSWGFLRTSGSLGNTRA